MKQTVCRLTLIALLIILLGLSAGAQELPPLGTTTPPATTSAGATTLPASSLPGTFTPTAAAPVITDVVVAPMLHIGPDIAKQVNAIADKLQGQPFATKTVNATLDSILDLGWFRRGNWTNEPVAGGVKITFTFTENPVIQDVQFIGNTVMTSAELLAVIKSKPGDVLNQIVARGDAQAIRRAYALKGYTIVGIKDITIDDKGVLTFSIVESKFGDIKIVGNARTKPRVILRELTFKPGEVYNENALSESLTDLDHLGIFHEVTVEPAKGNVDDTVDLTFHVTEEKTGLAQFGVTYSDADGMGLMVQLTDNNVGGTAQQVSVSGDFGKESQYVFSYTNPWIDNHRTSLSGSLYDSIITHRLNALDVDYDEHRIGRDITLGRPLDSTTRIYGTLRDDDIYGTASVGVAEKIPNVIDPAVEHSVGLSVERDTRRPFLDPSQGYFLSASSEVAGFGGVKYVKDTVEARRYFVVKPAPAPPPGSPMGTRRPDPWVFATRVSSGIIGGQAPFADNFLAGGVDASLLRGYEDGQFPGQYLLLMNNELRIPTTDSIQLVGFMDVGDAWGGRFGGQFGDSSFQTHIGYGVGMRIQTPIGAFHFDYGFNNAGGHKFHFGIGPTF